MHRSPSCRKHMSKWWSHTVQVVWSHSPYSPETRSGWSWAEWSQGRVVRFPFLFTPLTTTFLRITRLSILFLCQILWTVLWWTCTCPPSLKSFVISHNSSWQFFLASRKSLFSARFVIFRGLPDHFSGSPRSRHVFNILHWNKLFPNQSNGRLWYFQQSEYHNFCFPRVLNLLPVVWSHG